MVTANSKAGINVQILGYFPGTIDLLHLGEKDPSQFQIGKRILARILWDIPGTTPRQFALSLLPHVIQFTERLGLDTGSDLKEAYPIGFIFERAQVVRVEADRGLFMKLSDGIVGFVHVCIFSYPKGRTYLFI